MRPVMLPLLQWPMPNSAMVSALNPRSARYGCTGSRFCNANPSGLFGPSSSASGLLGFASFGGQESFDLFELFPLACFLEFHAQPFHRLIHHGQGPTLFVEVFWGYVRHRLVGIAIFGA